MPSVGLRFCKHPGCSKLQFEAYCSEHKKIYVQKPFQSVNQKVYDKSRANSYQRGYSRRDWREFRTSWLLDHPYCVECLKVNRKTLGTIVDHIKEREDATDLSTLIDVENVQTLCVEHHNRKIRKWTQNRKLVEGKTGLECWSETQATD